jgi:hypothetical protein
MSGFTKLVPEILQSSIWNEPSDIRIVWITLLAAKDENGYVRGNVRSLARLANVRDKSVEDALQRFQEPDPHSNTPDNEGRRIEAIPGGWFVLNHAIYRAKDHKTYEAERKREYRKNHPSGTRPGQVTDPSASASVSASVSASEEGDARGRKFKPPTPQEVEEYANSIGYPMNGEAWCDSYAVKGWKVGRNSMKDWKAAIRTWKNNNWVPAVTPEKKAAFWK